MKKKCKYDYLICEIIKKEREIHVSFVMQLNLRLWVYEKCIAKIKINKFVSERYALLKKLIFK